MGTFDNPKNRSRRVYPTEVRAGSDVQELNPADSTRRKNTEDDPSPNLTSDLEEEKKNLDKEDDSDEIVIEKLYPVRPLFGQFPDSKETEGTAPARVQVPPGSMREPAPPIKQTTPPPAPKKSGFLAGLKRGLGRIGAALGLYAAIARGGETDEKVTPQPLEPENPTEMPAQLTEEAATTAPEKAPEAEQAKPSEEIIKLSTVRAGEGPTHAMLRQVMASPESFGFDPKTMNPAEFVKNLAIETGAITVDDSGKIINETRIEKPDSFAFVLNTDNQGKHFTNIYPVETQVDKDGKIISSKFSEQPVSGQDVYDVTYQDEQNRPSAEEILKQLHASIDRSNLVSQITAPTEKPAVAETQSENSTVAVETAPENSTSAAIIPGVEIGGTVHIKRKGEFKPVTVNKINEDGTVCLVDNKNRQLINQKTNDANFTLEDVIRTPHVDDIVKVKIKGEIIEGKVWKVKPDGTFGIMSLDEKEIIKTPLGSENFSLRYLAINES
ncbi:MAG: hypothetical protein WC752_03035 [Patescibacteria group bacterium]|jgi:hypothetical protein